MSAACCRPHPAPEPTLGRAIPGPTKLLDLAEGVALPPGDYGTTPGGTLFGTTPGVSDCPWEHGQYDQCHNIYVNGMEAWTWLTTNIQTVVASEKFIGLVFVKPIATTAEKIYSQAWRRTEDSDYITLLDATDYSSHNPGLASGNGKLLRNGSYKAYALNGGTRIIYDRKFLMACRNSPVAKTPPCNLPDIPGVTNPSMDELQTDINFMSADDEKPGLGEEAQFDIDI